MKLHGNIIISLITLATFTSCGFTSGFLRDSTTAQQIRYNLDIGFQRYLRSVSGSATSGSVFCAFPLRSGANKYREAMLRLYEEAKLGPNQAVINLREDHQFYVYLGFYCSDTVTISGDVVVFEPTSQYRQNNQVRTP